MAGKSEFSWVYQDPSIAGLQSVIKANLRKNIEARLKKKGHFHSALSKATRNKTDRAFKAVSFVLVNSDVTITNARQVKKEAAPSPKTPRPKVLERELKKAQAKQAKEDKKLAAVDKVENRADQKASFKGPRDLEREKATKLRADRREKEGR